MQEVGFDRYGHRSPHRYEPSHPLTLTFCKSCLPKIAYQASILPLLWGIFIPYSPHAKNKHRKIASIFFILALLFLPTLYFYACPILYLHIQFYIYYYSLDFASCSARNALPHFVKALITGFSVCPTSVNSYSTFGGTSA